MDPHRMAAVMLARDEMFGRLHAEYPDDAVRLYAIACAGAVADLLSSEAGPDIVSLLNVELAGSPWQITPRRPN